MVKDGMTRAAAIRTRTRAKALASRKDRTWKEGAYKNRGIDTQHRKHGLSFEEGMSSTRNGKKKTTTRRTKKTIEGLTARLEVKRHVVARTKKVA